MPNKPDRCALYARISTQEGRQHLENQMSELRAWAKDEELPVSGVWTDEESGTDDARPGLQELLGVASGRVKTRTRFSVLLIWDLSRLTRGGPGKAFEYIARLKKHGVEVWSLKEPLFRTGPDGAGEVFIALAAHLAREENRIRKERIVSGVKRAQLAGKKMGRPEVPVDLERLKKLVREGLSVRQVARALGCDQTTAYRRMQRLKIMQEGKA